MQFKMCSRLLLIDDGHTVTLPIWNHNIHYHRCILDAIPPHCGEALDVGCGGGHLAQQLTLNCKHVVAVDLDSGVLEQARAANTAGARIEFLQTDAMTHPFSPKASTSLRQSPLCIISRSFQR